MGKDVTGHFTEDTHVSNKHLKKRSTLLATRGVPVKTTMRCHHTPIRIVTIKKKISENTLQGRGATGSRRHCGWECEVVWPLCTDSYGVVCKTEFVLP